MLSRRAGLALLTPVLAASLLPTLVARADTGGGNGGNGGCTSSVAGGRQSIVVCVPGGGGGGASDYVPAADIPLPPCWFADPYSPDELLAMWKAAAAAGDEQEIEIMPTEQAIQATIGQPGSWYGAECQTGLPADVTVGWGAANGSYKFFPPGDTVGLITPADLAKLASKHLPVPATQVTLDPAARSTVNAPTTVTVHNPGPQVARAAIGNLWGQVTATAETMWVDVPEVAQGIATVSPTCSQAQPQTFGGGDASCQVTYQRSTYHLAHDATTGYSLTVHVAWQFTYTGGPPGVGELGLPGPQVYEGRPVTENVVVQEIQTVVVP